MNDGSSMRADNLVKAETPVKDFTDDSSKKGLQDLVVTGLRKPKNHQIGSSHGAAKKEDTCGTSSLIPEEELSPCLSGSTSHSVHLDTTMPSALLSNDADIDIEARRLFHAATNTRKLTMRRSNCEHSGGEMVDKSRCTRRRLREYLDIGSPNYSEDDDEGYESDDSIDVGRRRMIQRASQRRKVRGNLSLDARSEQSLRHSIGNTLAGSE